MQAYAATGVSMLGGCCGTTPEYIARLRELFAPLSPAQKIPLRRSCLCTPVRFVEVDGITVVGERINPTGKKRLQQALREGDSAYPCAQAVAQAEAGAEILDVNAGFAGIDEAAVLERLVGELQAVTDLPLQLDSSNPEALARGAARLQRQNPSSTSVNGEQKTLDAVLPLCKKYGAAVVGLTLDEKGIPQTAGQRVEIARKIVEAACAAGIPKEDIYIDCLTLTASAQQEGGRPDAGGADPLQAGTRCAHDPGGFQHQFRAALPGVSQYHLPDDGDGGGFGSGDHEPQHARDDGGSAGLPGADGPGPPRARPMWKPTPTYRSKAARWAGWRAGPSPARRGRGDALAEAVRRGLKEEARTAARAALAERDPLEVVNTSLIPALDTVGDGFEKGTIFLPQLLQAATAAQAAFEEVKEKIAAPRAASDDGQGQDRAGYRQGRCARHRQEHRPRDPGKLRATTVLDLGRDVPPERVVEAVRATGAKLVGLSALMTTTVPNMKATIDALHAAGLPCRVWVGGAVLTPRYAQEIGADFYCKDAKASADLARQMLG